MKSLVFSLACFLVVACGSSKKGSEDMEASTSTEARPDGGLAPLQAIYEIRERDGDAKVGMVYKRDHDAGRSIYWVYDARGNRRGFVTEENRGYSYDWTMGKRSDKAEFIGSDTLNALARRIIGHARAVRLREIDIEAWASAVK